MSSSSSKANFCFWQSSLFILIFIENSVVWDEIWTLASMAAKGASGKFQTLQRSPRAIDKIKDYRILTKRWSSIFNEREPKICLGWVFNFKLDSFTPQQKKCTTSTLPWSRKLAPGFVLFADVCPWTKGILSLEMNKSLLIEKSALASMIASQAIL